VSDFRRRDIIKDPVFKGGPGMDIRFNREKPELFNRNHPENSRLNWEKPEPELFNQNCPGNTRFNQGILQKSNFNQGILQKSNFNQIMR